MVDAFIGVWESLLSFITGLFPSIVALFYADGGLTFVGVMAIVAAGVAIMLLVFNLIRSFLTMRG